MQFIIHFHALLQGEEPHAENVIKGKAVELELTASEQSCQRQLQKQEQQPQWQLRSRGIKSSESDRGVETAPKCQVAAMISVPSVPNSLSRILNQKIQMTTSLRSNVQHIKDLISHIFIQHLKDQIYVEMTF